ncbi:hypothetical protein OK016_08000 [Vibrio chagasii]|nr:hypothetical protein [Vibrio chagasii]
MRVVRTEGELTEAIRNDTC